MKKAAISSIIAIILGYLGTVFGAEIMNWPQLGPILSIVVMAMPLSQLFEVLFDSSVVVKYPIF